jgi:hypothetical protein
LYREQSGPQSEKADPDPEVPGFVVRVRKVLLDEPDLLAQRVANLAPIVSSRLVEVLLLDPFVCCAAEKQNAPFVTY